MNKIDPPTEKQINAIINMRRAFHINDPLPETKSEASTEIQRLKKIIDNNVSATGLVNPSDSSAWGADNEDDWLDPIF